MSSTAPRSGRSTAGIRLPCQVCWRMLTPRADGLARPHGRGGRCQGAGYRLARWEVGQQLAHYTGSVFEILEDRSTSEWGDYLVTCVWSQTGFDGKPMEDVGRERVFHGEYLHRDGWKPVPPDLMAALKKSLTEARA